MNHEYSVPQNREVWFSPMVRHRLVVEKWGEFFAGFVNFPLSGTDLVVIYLSVHPQRSIPSVCVDKPTGLDVDNQVSTSLAAVVTGLLKALKIHESLPAATLLRHHNSISMTRHTTPEGHTMRRVRKPMFYFG
jgi:hypothetical protein